jgi:hypothetical protein
VNLLVVGSGPGSWTMRGRQLGAAIGAKITSQPAFLDWGWADAVILVKRAGAIWADTAHRYKVPIIWDALDFWQQPGENGSTEAMARLRLEAELLCIQPALYVGATEAMAAAGWGVYLPHHGRPDLHPTPAREVARIVGYDGEPRYLGRWAMALDRACQDRGWQFVINPPDLAACDLLVAFRDGEWDGWMNRQWKSGVKLVNAIRAGRPILSQASAAWDEIRPCGTIVESMTDLPEALEAWAEWGPRDRAYASGLLLAADYSVEAIGARYQRLIATMARQGATV